MTYEKALATLTDVTTPLQVSEAIQDLMHRNQHAVLVEFNQQIGDEIEQAIEEGNTQRAIWKLSQSVLIEDYILALEREFQYA